jgi:putative oxidoreductase
LFAAWKGRLERRVHCRRRHRSKQMVSNLFSTDPDWTLTAIRVILGVVFFAHGAQKMLGWFGGAGLKETLRTMHEFLHLPVPLAFLAVTSEFLGGMGLIVGLLSRVAAIGIGVTMLSAIAMVHGRNGLFMNWLGDRKGHGIEYHLLAIALAIAIVVWGSGAASLDRLLFISQ